MQSEDIRLVLTGKTGSGKSACGNTILGRKVFESHLSGSSITKTCQLETIDLDEEHDVRRLMVIDTPGYGNTHLSEEEVHTEITKCLALTAFGLHVFLLVVALGRYNEADDRAIDQLAQIFGEEAVRQHTLVLFTRGDDLEGTVESFVKIASPGLQALIRRCGARYHVFNNKNACDSAQVKELISKVEKMAKQTATGFYTIEMYNIAAAAIEKQQKIQGQLGSSSSRGRQTQPDRSSSCTCLRCCVNGASTAGATGHTLGAFVRLVHRAFTAVVGFINASVHFASSLLTGEAAGAAVGDTAEAVAATEADSTSEAVDAQTTSGEGPGASTTGENFWKFETKN